MGPNSTVVLLYVGTRGVGSLTATLDARHIKHKKLNSTAHRTRHKSIVTKVAPKGPTPWQSSPDLGQHHRVPQLSKRTHPRSMLLLPLCFAHQAKFWLLGNDMEALCVPTGIFPISLRLIPSCRRCRTTATVRPTPKISSGRTSNQI